MTLEEIEKGMTPGNWFCDVRVGCIAVYPAPQLNCLNAIPRRFLAYWSGHKTESGEWNTLPRDRIHAQLFAASHLLPRLVRGLEWGIKIAEWASPGVGIELLHEGTEYDGTAEEIQNLKTLHADKLKAMRQLLSEVREALGIKGEEGE